MEKCPRCLNENTCKGFDILIRVDNFKIMTIYRCEKCNKTYGSELKGVSTKDEVLQLCENIFGDNYATTRN